MPETEFRIQKVTVFKIIFRDNERVNLCFLPLPTFHFGSPGWEKDNFVDVINKACASF